MVVVAALTATIGPSTAEASTVRCHLSIQDGDTNGYVRAIVAKGFPSGYSCGSLRHVPEAWMRYSTDPSGRVSFIALLRAWDCGASELGDATPAAGEDAVMQKAVFCKGRRGAAGRHDAQRMSVRFLYVMT